MNQVATITVEVTAQRKLEKSFSKLTGDLLWTGNQEHRWLARALHDSINEYHAVITTSLARLTTSLGSLGQQAWEPERSAEILAESIEWLDQRLGSMRPLSRLIRNFRFLHVSDSSSELRLRTPDSTLDSRKQPFKDFATRP